MLAGACNPTLCVRSRLQALQEVAAAEGAELDDERKATRLRSAEATVGLAKAMDEAERVHMAALAGRMKQLEADGKAALAEKTAAIEADAAASLEAIKAGVAAKLSADTVLFLLGPSIDRCSRVAQRDAAPHAMFFVSASVVC